VQSLGVLDLSISEPCQLIQQRRSLQQEIITMTEGYTEPAGGVLHRFLVLGLAQGEEANLSATRQTVGRRRFPNVTSLQIIRDPRQRYCE